jgi:hypothetical protein
MKITAVLFAITLAASSSLAFAAGGGGGAAGGGGSSSGSSSATNGSGATTAPGTNSVGTAQSSGATSDLKTAGQARSNRGGRIDGTTTNGPALPGDDTIQKESSPESNADRMIKGICRGC